MQNEENSAAVTGCWNGAKYLAAEAAAAPWSVDRSAGFGRMVDERDAAAAAPRAPMDKSYRRREGESERRGGVTEQQ